MPKLIKLFSLLLVIGITGKDALAQSSAAPPKHYKADFVVKEIDSSGRVINSRSYSTILGTNNDSGVNNQIRSGDRIPIRTSNTAKNDIEFQYIDIGVSIDCRRVQEIDGKLSMSVKAEISSLPGGANSNPELDPVIRSFQWNSDVVVAPGIPTTLFSSDDSSSKARMQVEVTATPIK